MPQITRRALLAGSVPVLGGGVVIAQIAGASAHAAGSTAPDPMSSSHGGGAMGGTDPMATPHAGGHAAFRDGAEVDHSANGFNPHELVRDFDWGRTSRLPSGRVLREWELDAAQP